MIEQDAVAQLRRRDPAGLTVLVQLYQIPGLRLAFAILGNRADAEDVVADSFIAAFDRIGQLGSSSPFEPWFMRIVVNRSLSLRRRTERTARVIGVLYWHRWHEQADPQALVERHDASQMLRAAVSGLPAIERATLVLRYYLDQDEQTIARTLGCPVGTVKTRLRRARLRLQARLPPHLDSAAFARA